MADDKSRAQSEAYGEQHAVATPGVRRWTVGDLMGQAREVVIEHAGQDYRLRVTASGKLILTK